MNILINALLLNDRFSGMQYSTENLLKAIREITPLGNKIEVLLPRGYTGILSAAEGFKINKLPFSTLNRFRRIFYENFKLLPYFNKKGFNLYHSTSNILPYFSRGQSILTVHDLIPIDYPQYSSIETSIYYRLSLSRSIRKAKKIIAVSNKVKEDIISRYEIDPNKIHVVYHGVEKDFKKIDDPQLLQQVTEKYKLPKSFLFFIGNLEPRKNLLRVIDAFIHLKRHKQISQKLVIAGKNGWKYQAIYQKVKLEKMEDEILFTGYVDRTDLPSIYSLCSLFVFPSLYEGFGLPVLEAMACETPVLISDQGALPEVTDNILPQANAFDVQDIADKIHLLLTNSNIRNQNIQHGTRRAKDFTWEKTAQETLKVYHQILEGSEAPLHQPTRTS